MADPDSHCACPCPLPPVYVGYVLPPLSVVDQVIGLNYNGNTLRVIDDTDLDVKIDGATIVSSGGQGLRVPLDADTLQATVNGIGVVYNTSTLDAKNNGLTVKVNNTTTQRTDDGIAVRFDATKLQVGSLGLEEVASAPVAQSHEYFPVFSNLVNCNLTALPLEPVNYTLTEHCATLTGKQRFNWVGTGPTLYGARLGFDMSLPNFGVDVSGARMCGIIARIAWLPNDVTISDADSFMRLVDLDDPVHSNTLTMYSLPPDVVFVDGTVPGPADVFFSFSYMID